MEADIDELQLIDGIGRSNIFCLKLTQKLKEAVKTIDVTVHDHLIIARNTQYSFAENN